MMISSDEASKGNRGGGLNSLVSARPMSTSSGVNVRSSPLRPTITGRENFSSSRSLPIPKLSKSIGGASKLQGTKTPLISSPDDPEISSSRQGRNAPQSATLVSRSNGLAQSNFCESSDMNSGHLKVEPTTSVTYISPLSDSYNSAASSSPFGGKSSKPLIGGVLAKPKGGAAGKKAARTVLSRSAVSEKSKGMECCTSDLDKTNISIPLKPSKNTMYKEETQLDAEESENKISITISSFDGSLRSNLSEKPENGVAAVLPLLDLDRVKSSQPADKGEFNWANTVLLSSLGNGGSSTAPSGQVRTPNSESAIREEETQEFKASNYIHVGPSSPGVKNTVASSSSALISNQTLPPSAFEALQMEGNEVDRNEGLVRPKEGAVDNIAKFSNAIYSIDTENKDASPSTMVNRTTYISSSTDTNELLFETSKAPKPECSSGMADASFGKIGEMQESRLPRSRSEGELGDLVQQPLSPSSSVFAATLPSAPRKQKKKQKKKPENEEVNSTVEGKNTGYNHCEEEGESEMTGATLCLRFPEDNDAQHSPEGHFGAPHLIHDVSIVHHHHHCHSTKFSTTKNEGNSVAKGSLPVSLSPTNSSLFTHTPYQKCLIETASSHSSGPSGVQYKNSRSGENMSNMNNIYSNANRGGSYSNGTTYYYNNYNGNGGMNSGSFNGSSASGIDFDAGGNFGMQRNGISHHPQAQFYPHGVQGSAIMYPGMSNNNGNGCPNISGNSMTGGGRNPSGGQSYAVHNNSLHAQHYSNVHNAVLFTQEIGPGGYINAYNQGQMHPASHMPFMDTDNGLYNVPTGTSTYGNSSNYPLGDQNGKAPSSACVQDPMLAHLGHLVSPTEPGSGISGNYSHPPRPSDLSTGTATDIADAFSPKNFLGQPDNSSVGYPTGVGVKGRPEVNDGSLFVPILGSSSKKEVESSSPKQGEDRGSLGSPLSEQLANPGYSGAPGVFPSVPQSHRSTFDSTAVSEEIKRGREELLHRKTSEISVETTSHPYGGAGGQYGPNVPSYGSIQPQSSSFPSHPSTHTGKAFLTQQPCHAASASSLAGSTQENTVNSHSLNAGSHFTQRREANLHDSLHESGNINRTRAAVGTGISSKESTVSHNLVEVENKTLKPSPGCGLISNAMDPSSFFASHVGWEGRVPHSYSCTPEVHPALEELIEVEVLQYLIPSQEGLQLRRLHMQQVACLLEEAITHTGRALGLPAYGQIRMFVFGSVNMRTVLPDGDNDLTLEIDGLLQNTLMAGKNNSNSNSFTSPERDGMKGSPTVGQSSATPHPLTAENIASSSNGTLQVATTAEGEPFLVPPVAVGLAAGELFQGVRDYLLMLEEQASSPVCVDALVSAEVRVLKLIMNGYHFDVTVGQAGGVNCAHFFHVLDVCVGQHHLLKRTMLLLKAWFSYEAHIFGGQAGYLSSYVVSIMLISLLNVVEFIEDFDESMGSYPSMNRTPEDCMREKNCSVNTNLSKERNCEEVDGRSSDSKATSDSSGSSHAHGYFGGSSCISPLVLFARFLKYYAYFDFDNYCVTPFGPVPLDALQSNTPVDLTMYEVPAARACEDEGVAPKASTQEAKEVDIEFLGLTPEGEAAIGRFVRRRQAPLLTVSGIKHLMDEMNTSRMEEYQLRYQTIKRSCAGIIDDDPQGKERVHHMKDWSSAEEIIGFDSEEGVEAADGRFASNAMHAEHERPRVTKVPLSHPSSSEDSHLNCSACSTLNFPIRKMNVIDPLRWGSNITRGVCKNHLQRILAAFREGLRRLNSASQYWKSGEGMPPPEAAGSTSAVNNDIPTLHAYNQGDTSSASSVLCPGYPAPFSLRTTGEVEVLQFLFGSTIHAIKKNSFRNFPWNESRMSAAATFAMSRYAPRCFHCLYPSIFCADSWLHHLSQPQFIFNPPWIPTGENELEQLRYIGCLGEVMLPIDSPTMGDVVPVDMQMGGSMYEGAPVLLGENGEELIEEVKGINPEIYHAVEEDLSDGELLGVKGDTMLRRPGGPSQLQDGSYGHGNEMRTSGEADFQRVYADNASTTPMKNAMRVPSSSTIKQDGIGLDSALLDGGEDAQGRAYSAPYHSQNSGSGSVGMMPSELYSPNSTGTPGGTKHGLNYRTTPNHNGGGGRSNSALSSRVNLAVKHIPNANQNSLNIYASGGKSSNGVGGAESSGMHSGISQVYQRPSIASPNHSDENDHNQMLSANGRGGYQMSLQHQQNVQMYPPNGQRYNVGSPFPSDSRNFGYAVNRNNTVGRGHPSSNASRQVLMQQHSPSGNPYGQQSPYVNGFPGYPSNTGGYGPAPGSIPGVPYPSSYGYGYPSNMAMQMPHNPGQPSNMVMLEQQFANKPAHNYHNNSSMHSNQGRANHNGSGQRSRQSFGEYGEVNTGNVAGDGRGMNSGQKQNAKIRKNKGNSNSASGKRFNPQQPSFIAIPSRPVSNAVISNNIYSSSTSSSLPSTGRGKAE